MPALVVAILAAAALAASARPAPEVDAFLQQHFQLRAGALLAGAVGDELARQFDRSTATGRWLLAREQQKAAHVNGWARARGYRLVDRKVEVKVLRARSDGATARAAVIFRLGIGYRPGGAPGGSVDWMGVGTSHVMDLVRAGDTWLVRRDYALDPLYEQGPPPGVEAPAYMHSPPDTLAGLAAAAAGPVPGAPRRFNRAAAARYADTYCGIAWGCGNSHRYNRRYRDFTGDGGDCANFASQILVAGGLRPGGGWLYDVRRREATAAWINAGQLVHQLLNGGKAQLVARGRFAQATAAAGGAALPRLAPGDIIGYEQKGDIAHVSVVVGTNAAGYTVVSSHTADRHHVPWDLGWGEDTRFWLLRIRE